MMDVGESLPKLGHVNEVCKEWTVREDGALAYTLQSQEINDYYKGNKFRNAVVRQDFPTALNEQIKEKEMAEKQSAIYHVLLCEQEETDKKYAEELARSIEMDREKRLKEAEIGELVAKQLQDIYLTTEIQNKRNFQRQNLELERKSKHDHVNSSFIQNQNTENLDDERNFLQINSIEHPHLHINKTANYIGDNIQQIHKIDVADSIRQYDLSPCNDRNIARTTNEKDKYHSNRLVEDAITNIGHLQKLSPEKYDYLMGNRMLLGLEKNSICPTKTEADVNLSELGLSPEEIEEIEIKLHQEKKDEELARHLQYQEQKVSLTQEEKDRLLAIEAQDKELARMLQEREKAKAKRAKEKARLKRNQQKIVNPSNEVSLENDNNLQQFEEQDSYSNPIDLISSDERYNSKNIVSRDTIEKHIKEDDIYALPIEATGQNLHPLRPKSLHIKEITPQPHIIRSDTSDAISTGMNFANSPQMSSPISKTISPIEKDTSPVPPYMPIQGTRRSSDGKKKKYKEKCAHQ